MELNLEGLLLLKGANVEKSFLRIVGKDKCR